MSTTPRTPSKARITQADIVANAQHNAAAALHNAAAAPAATPALLAADTLAAGQDRAEHDAAYAAALARIAVLEGANTELRARLAAVRGQLTEAEAIADLGKLRKQQRPARIVPQDELERVQKMAIAKAQAAAMGYSVKA